MSASGIVDTEKSQPYAPEGASRIGVPPINGTGGERGSNAFGGTDVWNADGSPVDPTAPVTGPAIGTAYHSTESPVQSDRVVARKRDAAASVGGLLVPELALTASSLTPVHGVDVTLTATASSGSTTAVSGTVTFKDGSTTLGTAALSGEVATFTVTGGFTTGSHTLRASLPASSNFEAKTSPAVTLTAT